MRVGRFGWLFGEVRVLDGRHAVSALAFVAGGSPDVAPRLRRVVRAFREADAGPSSRDGGLEVGAFLAAALTVELLRFGMGTDRAVALVAGGTGPLEALSEEWREPRSVRSLIVQFPMAALEGASASASVDRDPLAVVEPADLAAWIEDRSDPVGRLLVIRVADLVARARDGLDRAVAPAR